MSAPTDLSTVKNKVLSAINDMMGRLVLINTTERKRYSGVLSAVSPDFAFGLRYVVEITKENQNNLLRTESEVVDKMLFNITDIVDFVYATEEDKNHHLVSKFVTDRQYHGEAPNDNEELREWNGGEEGGYLGGSIEDDVVTLGSQSALVNNHNNGTGWSVNEMFAVNKKMNVVTTFKDDLTQYTTVEVVGTEEDRTRAERLAREIESNPSSKFMANLENDDDERDLDKATRQEDFENGNNQRGGKRNSSYNQPPQQRRNSNITPNGQPVNRRAEGLCGDRRNSGCSSANNSRNEWQMVKRKGQNQGHDHSFRQQRKQMLDARPSSKQQGDDKSQSYEPRVPELKNLGNKLPIATSSKEQSLASESTPPAPQGNSGSAWNRGPPSSLVAKGASVEPIPPSTESETATVNVSKPETLKEEERPPTSEGALYETDGKQDCASETSESLSFKFNTNAPEFKPRVAPTTPTPTTPTEPMPQNMNPVQPLHFVPPGMISQGGSQGPAMVMQGGMIPHMGPGGVPPNQAQPIMMWQPGQKGCPQSQQYSNQQVAMPGVPGQMYGAAATAPVTVSQQALKNQQKQASGGTTPGGGQGIPPPLRQGEYREAHPLFHPYAQSGQIVQFPQQQQRQQGQLYRGTGMVGASQHHMGPFMVMSAPHQMHSQIPNYYQHQPMYYQPMTVQQPMPMQLNQNGQQNLMGERSQPGYSQTVYFDYRTMPNYQQSQQQQQQPNSQIHAGNTSRQASMPQQLGGNQALKA